MTVFFAVLAIFALPDFPESTKWLSSEERELALQRMEEDVGVGDQSGEEGTGAAAGLTMAFTDWKVWWMALALTSQVVGLSFNAYFPTLSTTLGYDTTISLVLCAPPWIFTTILAFVVSR